MLKSMNAVNFEQGEKHAKFPMMVQPKIDGIRMMVKDGVGWTRGNKKIPNHHIQKFVKDNAVLLEGMDGELAIPGENFNTSSGVIRSFTKSIDTLAWTVFDDMGHPGRTALDRQKEIEEVLILHPVSKGKFKLSQSPAQYVIL